MQILLVGRTCYKAVFSEPKANSPIINKSVCGVLLAKPGCTELNFLLGVG